MLSRLSFKQVASVMALALPLLFGGCHSSEEEVYYESNTLFIQNDIDSNFDIWSVYVSPSGSLFWGEDLLGSDVLWPGGELIVDVYDCDRLYDIRVEYDDGVGTIIEKLDVWLPCNTATYVTYFN